MGTLRRCARVLLVDGQSRVLLFSGVDRTKPAVPPWWFTVGGALEPGETLRDAAIRETREETGLVVSDPGAVVFTRQFHLEFEGQEHDQEESFFFVYCPAFEPSPDGWTVTEMATMRGHRWWTVGELRATDEAVFPEDLADQLEGLLAA